MSESEKKKEFVPVEAVLMLISTLQSFIPVRMELAGAHITVNEMIHDGFFNDIKDEEGLHKIMSIADGCYETAQDATAQVKSHIVDLITELICYADMLNRLDHDSQTLYGMWHRVKRELIKNPEITEEELGDKVENVGYMMDVYEGLHDGMMKFEFDNFSGDYVGSEDDCDADYREDDEDEDYEDDEYAKMASAFHKDASITAEPDFDDENPYPGAYDKVPIDEAVSRMSDPGPVD